MDRRLQYLVRISGDRDRRLIILGVVLTVLCLALYINLTIMLAKRSSNKNSEEINNKTTADITSPTSDNLTYVITSERTTTSSVQFTSSITTLNPTEQYQNYTLLNPIEYEQSVGRPLGNTLYWNTNQFCFSDGYVSSIYLRLFTNWTGNAPLYVFIVKIGFYGFEFKQRYVIQPQRDTTDWQIINIPSHELLISVGNFVAIGMQDSSNTNQIYGVKSDAREKIIGMSVKNINENTTVISLTNDLGIGVALGYTTVTTAKTTTMKTASVR